MKTSKTTKKIIKDKKSTKKAVRKADDKYFPVISSLIHLPWFNQVK